MDSIDAHKVMEILERAEGTEAVMPVVSTAVAALATAPAPASDSSPAPALTQAAGYIKCSLCNNIVDHEEIHLQREHDHLKHLHTMLKVPLSPPPTSSSADEEAAMRALGVFVVATSQNADRGAAAFRVMQRAQQQLHRLLDGLQGSQGNVYVFGSVVSMGCWDGVGDGDFAFIDPKWYHTSTAQDGTAAVVEEDDDEGEEVKEHGGEAEDGTRDGDAAEAAATPQGHWDPQGTVEGSENVPNLDAALAATVAVLDEQVLSASKEKRIICNITARLRDAGFRFDELDPVMSTRIPVVRRKRPTHEPLNMQTMRNDQLICVRFDRSSSEEEFRRGRLPTLLETYNAREETGTRGQRGNQLLISVPDSTDAVHLMSRRERIAGVRKGWMVSWHRPELFVIDFDLSCRYHGIRNSWLLRRYLQQSEVFRMGNVFLKTWSKACGINNSRVGFLTSYAISVLWVYFLLRHNEAEFVDPDSIPVLPDPEKQMDVPYIPLWPPLDDPAAAAQRTVRLGRLLRDFFFFYGEVFDWEQHVVTIRQPCRTAADVRTKADLDWLKSDTASLLLRNRVYHVFSIEDVYEDDLDLGRHLTPDKAAWTRLQFRLAFQRCCSGGSNTPALMRLLEDTRKRAKEVLQARLFEHLLATDEDAEAVVADLLPVLSQADTPSKKGSGKEEDLAYLLSAFELGNRLCDLWYDEPQIKQDVENHKKHDRRGGPEYAPPVDPTQQGEWGLLCTDRLEADGDPVEVQVRRCVRLMPPAVSGSRATDARGARERARSISLMKALNEYKAMAAQLSTGVQGAPAAVGKHAKAMAAAAAPTPALVGVPLPKTAKESVYVHCFYALHAQRLFGSYDAREVFVHALEDVAWELARLHELATPEALSAVSKREHFYSHLKGRFGPLSSALPGYLTVLHFIVVPTTDYVVFENKGPDGAVLMPSPQLLRVVGSGGGGGGPSAASHATAGSARAAGNAAARRPAAAAGQAAPPKMDTRGRKNGTCGECGKHNAEVFPSLNVKADSGFYCAACWKNYS